MIFNTFIDRRTYFQKVSKTLIETTESLSTQGPQGACLMVLRIQTKHCNQVLSLCEMFLKPLLHFLS